MISAPESSVLQAEISSRLEQLDVHIQGQLQAAQPRLLKSLMVSCAREVGALALWSANADLQQASRTLEHLLQAVLSETGTVQGKLLPALFAAQLRINNAAKTELRQLWQGRQDKAKVLLTNMQPDAEAELQQLVLRTQQLQHFLSDTVAEKPCRVAEAERRETFKPGHEWQGMLAAQIFSVYEEKLQALGLIKQQLVQLLHKITDLCTHSKWTSASFVESSLLIYCTQILSLSQFCYDRHYQSHLGKLAEYLLLRHVQAQAPGKADLQAILHMLMNMALGKVDAVCWPAMPSPDSLLTLDNRAEILIRAELSAYIDVLKRELTSIQQLEPASQQTLVSESLLLVSYKLTWVLQSCACTRLSNLNQCLYQVYLQHWSLRLPLPAGLLSVAKAFIKSLSRLITESISEADFSAESVTAMYSALACWPQHIGNAGMLIGLNSAARQRPAGLPLDRLPEYLSAEFSVLLSAQAWWFGSQEQVQQHMQDVQEELRLLEKGAAAFRLDVLEAYCTLLLDAYLLLQLYVKLSITASEFPGALLWMAHQSLVAMLDRAAAWLEPVVASENKHALLSWLSRTDEHLDGILREQAELGFEHTLELGLIRFARDAGKLLGRSVRLQVELDAALPENLMQTLSASLKEVLRWMLLQGEVENETRRKQHKPLAINLELNIKVLTPVHCQVVIIDDSCTSLLNQKQTYRLQKNTAFALQNIQGSTLAGQGRKFSFGVFGRSE